MSTTFREFLKKIGSGVHTGHDLDREEAEMAMAMMLQEEATPAQIGAFLIAHRIKRPTPTELAGMLDAYDRFGPKLKGEKLTFDKPVTVLGTPYDGRSRTVPVTPVTALLLVTAGIPVITHGGDCMPTKYGIPLVEIWRGLGIDFAALSLDRLQPFFEKTGLAFIYLPQHFPQAQALVPYRDQIGKRPPIATLELIWCPYEGDAHIMAGFVHPPTEERFQATLQMRGTPHFTTIKGLEGSCDLACSRTAILGLGQPTSPPKFERFLLNPRDYGFSHQDVPLESTSQLIEQIQSVLQGKPGDLMDAAILNGGFYLWRCGVAENLQEGFDRAKTMLISGEVARHFSAICHEL